MDIGVRGRHRTLVILGRVRQLLYSRAVPKPAALIVLVAPIAVQLGFFVTALPMAVMVLPLVAGMGWLSLILAKEPR